MTGVRSAATSFALAVLFVAGLLVPATARAGQLTLTSCTKSSSGQVTDNGNDTDLDGTVWTGGANGTFSTANECVRGGSFQIDLADPPKKGNTAQWETTAPGAIQITGALIPSSGVLVDPVTSDGFSYSYFWDGGSLAIKPVSKCCGGMDYGTGIARRVGPSHVFGWRARCTTTSCSYPFQVLDVHTIALSAVDNTPPSLVALDSNNIWYQTKRWIRGSGWQASFRATADDGICNMREVIGGAVVQGPYDGSPNPHSWTQCPTPVTMNQTVDTTQYPNGSLPITLWAADAASPANVSMPSATLHVDNTPVTLSLSGPADVAASPTNQSATVSASAVAGPSGVAGIDCSVDSGPYSEHPGASVLLGVSGIGAHSVSCYAQNNAYDANLRPATSAPQGFHLTIRQPTASALSFRRIANALRCHRGTVVVRVPRPPRIVKRHGRKVRIRQRPRLVRRHVRVCHTRTVRRKVTMVVKRHGKQVKITRIRRVALLPRTVEQSQLRVAHGRSTRVSGYLVQTNGVALAGRPVEVFSAADNGLGHFTPLATVKTSSSGTWTARVPAGPSRLIEAVYYGDNTTEPSISAPVRVIVPARITLSISPRVIPWSSSIRVRGRLIGGYVPPDGVALRLLVRYPAGRQWTPLLALRTNSRGGFNFKWSYHAGHGVVSYPFKVATTATESDYPFASASSRELRVTFGRTHPAAPDAPRPGAPGRRSWTERIGGAVSSVS